MDSTNPVCGDFTEPEVCPPGQSFPYRVKLDCEAPEIPDLVTLVYDPDAFPPFFQI